MSGFIYIDSEGKQHSLRFIEENWKVNLTEQKKEQDECLECEAHCHLNALKDMNINDPKICILHLRNALCFILEALNWEEEAK